MGTYNLGFSSWEQPSLLNEIVWTILHFFSIRSLALIYNISTNKFMNGSNDDNRERLTNCQNLGVSMQEKFSEENDRRDYFLLLLCG